MLGQLTQSVGGVIGDDGVVVHTGKGGIPSLVGLLLALPDVPGIAGVAEDGHLAGLRLLHGVEHDALDVVRVDPDLEEVGVTAHDQVLLGVVGAGPVDPHVGTAAGVLGEGAGEVVGHLAPDLTTGHDDLHVLGELGIVGLAPAHVLLGAERQGLLQIGVSLLHLLEPLGHVVEEADIIGASHIPGVVSQNGDLTHTGSDDLGKLVLHDLQISLVVLLGVKAHSVVHKGVQSKHKAALGGVAGLSQGLDLGLQLLLGVQLTPVGVVLGVVLGGVEVRVELVVAAPSHQIDPVLGAPGVAVVALDEATAGHVGPVLHMELLDGVAVHLGEHMVQSGQAIEAGVGVTAQHGDHTVLVVQDIGIQLVKQPVGGHLQVLLGVAVHIAAGAVDTHQNVGLAADHLVRGGVGDVPLQVQHLVQAVLGVLVDAVLEHHVDFIFDNVVSTCIGHHMGIGVNLIPGTPRVLGLGLEGGHCHTTRSHHRSQGGRSESASHMGLTRLSCLPSHFASSLSYFGRWSFPQKTKKARPPGATTTWSS